MTENVIIKQIALMIDWPDNSDNTTIFLDMNQAEKLSKQLNEIMNGLRKQDCPNCSKPFWVSGYDNLNLSAPPNRDTIIIRI